MNFEGSLRLSVSMISLLSILSLIINPNPRHKIPEAIIEEATYALSHYPSLADVAIEIKFKKNIKKSTMLARPAIVSFFQKRNRRSYIVLISEKFKISGRVYLTKDMPRDVMIGWLAHELGHIMDYQNRNKLNLLGFGMRYLLIHKHIVKAERAADYFAIQAGMERYVLATKDFILNSAELDPKYVARIKKYYISPVEVMEMVKIRDQAELEETGLQQ